MIKLESGNNKYKSGRICSNDLKSSVLITNKDMEQLLKNIEKGIKELAKKFLKEGYDLLSSCEGHEKEIAQYNQEKYIKICSERLNKYKVMKNINDINKENKVNINIGEVEENFEILSGIFSKNYKNPISLSINFGKPGENKDNYKAILKDFDKYEW